MRSLFFFTSPKNLLGDFFHSLNVNLKFVTSFRAITLSTSLEARLAKELTH